MSGPTFSSNPSQLFPSTAWREVIADGEQKLFEDFANCVIAAQQKEVAEQSNGTLSRGFHAKLHAGVVGEFQVLNDLPDYARFGVFTEARVFPAVVRFSNGTPRHQPDKRPEPRGIAIKLIGVSGDKLPPGNKHDVTQDFLATSHSVTSTVRNAGQFIAFIEAGRNPGLLPVNLARAVGVRESLRILSALFRTVVLSRVRSVATEHYSGTAPIQFGPYAVKFTVRPAEGTEPPARRRRTPDFLRNELADRLRKGDLMFDFVVQFYVDDERTPIEDTSVRWKPEEAPFVKVAQLRIPSCNLDDPLNCARSNMIDQYSFSPWHTIDEHRPLGNVMRARRVAYQASASLRGHCPEPISLPS
jgi:Catalase